MAIIDNGTRDQYTATAAQTVFQYTFEIFESGDLTVQVNGVTQSEGTDYTVSSVGNDNGGNVTFIVPRTAGEVITLFRDMDLDRETVYQQNGDFLADTVNNDFDRVWAAVQQVFSTANTGIRPTINDPALNASNTELANVATRGGKALAFNPDGTLAYLTGAIALGVNNDTTLAGMVNDANATVGQSVYRVSDRVNGIFDTVTTGVTLGVDLPNAANIIISVFNPLISFVLRVDGEVINVLQWGGGNSDPSIARQAVQAALDFVSNGHVTYFPKFLYVFEPPGVGVPVFIIDRNTSIIGESTRGASIRIDNADANTDVFEIAITQNGGFGDVRGWTCENMTMFFNGSGRHCLHKSTGGSILGMLNSQIKNCNLTANFNNGGRCFIADGGWTFSDVIHSDLRPGVTLTNVADGNTITHNIINGKGFGVILDLIQGAYKTAVVDNTIVNRDGQVHVINGEQITIARNQMEQDAAEGVNQDPISSQIYIEGRDYTCRHNLIDDNNFGGGTNVDNLITIDNAIYTIIDRNFMNPGNPAGFDIVLTANAQYTKFMLSNTVRTNGSNPRSVNRINVVASDLGVGTYGVLQDMATTLSPINGWSANGTYYKDPSTMEVVILGSFGGGTTTAGTNVATFPVGFRSNVLDTIPAATEGGVFVGQIATTGVITLKTATTGSVKAFRAFRFNAEGDPVTS